MKIKLTAKSIEKLQSNQKAYEVYDTDITGFTIRVEPSSTKTYYLIYKNREGTTKRYRIAKHGNIDTKNAREEVKRLLGKVASGIDIHEEKKQIRLEAKTKKAEKKKQTEAAKRHANRPTFTSYVNGAYKDWCLIERVRGDETIQRINCHFTPVFGSVYLDELKEEMLEQWKLKRRANGISESTINRDMLDAKNVLNKAVKDKHIAINPFNEVKLYKLDTTSRIRYLKPDERQRLLVALDRRDQMLKQKRDQGNAWRNTRNYTLMPSLHTKRYADYLKPIVILALNTGMRRGEIFKLKWQDIDFELRHIVVEGKNAKSGKTRYIEMNDIVYDLLIGWRQDQHNPDSLLIFPGDNDKPRNNIKKAWTSLLKAADIQNFRFHDLRHDFASQLVMKSVPLNTVRELLGHKDLVTTLRYAHLAKDIKAKAVATLVEPDYKAVYKPKLREANS